MQRKDFSPYLLTFDHYVELKRFNQAQPCKQYKLPLVIVVDRQVLGYPVHVYFTVILKENFQESIKKCIMPPLIHKFKYTLHEKLTNGLGKFEEGQGSVFHIPQVWKAARAFRALEDGRSMCI